MDRLFRTYSSASSSISVEENLRQIYINVLSDTVDGKPQNEKEKKSNFPSNYISTAKYSILSFLPKFLFEQFHRYANIFFLSIGLLQQIPNVSPTGRYVTIVPFFFILFLTAVKEIIEDVKRHAADDKLNQTPIAVYSHSFQGWLRKTWKDILVGDIVKVENNEFFPADLLLLGSSEVTGVAYIETSNLDGETNLKVRSSLSHNQKHLFVDKIHEFSGIIECQAPNRHLYEFAGNLKVKENEIQSLSSESFLLRGAKLMNTKMIFGAVIYSGHESKLLMNSIKTPLKRSNIDQITNIQIIYLFLILILVAGISAGANSISNIFFPGHDYLGTLKENSFGYNFLTFIILYNNLIPISLQVTLEIVKFIQAYFMNWDNQMVHNGIHAMARTSNLNEELGQIKYVFSDKTGTLTQNIMLFKTCSIGGIIYDHLDDPLTLNMEQDVVKQFLTVMSVCHSVIPEISSDGSLTYNASSPDEKALVEGAARYGFTFCERTSKTITVRLKGGEREKYKILNVIEFNSDRKRMTLIVQVPNGTIQCFVKGADNVIVERLGQNINCRKYLNVTMVHLDEMASRGLRTLVFATKTLSQKEYNDWNALWLKATTNIKNKEEEMEKMASLLERDLTLLGASAIEDKLQDGVPETISQLLEAGIHVWILTGDKQETAINIGYSCKLLQNEVSLLTINESSLDTTRNRINEYLTNPTHGCLIIDGESLKFALDDSLKNDFGDLCVKVQSVICCRVSPIQKAEMISLVRHKTKGISLAIGDGANDVAMIQRAHVGVGISGNEGLQAVNSSDFSIAQFRFLARLLFVHGAWNYTRIAKVILYCFYKNITLYIIELWFAIYSLWSGQVLFERWTIGMYNIFFTSAPPIAMGLFDQYCDARTRLKYPSLYQGNQRSESFNHKVFWSWILNSVIHSAFLFWLPVYAYTTGIIWKSGFSGDYLVLGNCVYTFVVITVCLKAGLEMSSWTILSHASIWGSILFWLLFLLFYSYFWPLGLPIAPDMAGMATLVFSTPFFWFGCLLIPLLTLIPDVLLITLTAPNNTDVIRSVELRKIFSKKEKPSEASSLLQNVRRRFRSSDSFLRVEEATRKGEEENMEMYCKASEEKNSCLSSSTTMKTAFRRSNRPSLDLIDHDHHPFDASSQCIQRLTIKVKLLPAFQVPQYAL